MSDSILPLITSKSFLAFSLGCRTNQAEIEEISLQLITHGFRQFYNPSLSLSCSPTLLLLNTCVVTAKAEKETRQKIRELRKKYPKSFLVVLGCAVTAKEKINIPIPQADLLIPNEQKNRTAEIIEQKFYPQPKINSVLANKYISSGRKFIKIQDGCDRYCSYCITCVLRGKPTSLPLEKVIEEINYWVGKGIKEIVLTGINIGLYGKDFKGKIDLINLIDLISKQTLIERISFSSIYPEMMTDEFTKLVVNNPHISQYFHLSLQSGSQTVLNKMNRKTNLNELLKKLKMIKTRNPLFNFRADIITGFPGEIEAEFQETLNFIKKAKISFAHIFTFSKRKGTLAYENIKSGKWQDLPENIKKERSEKIRKTVESIRCKEAKKMIGLQLRCLIIRKQKKYWEGITENGWTVKLSNCQIDKLRIKKNIKGKILPVRITGFEGNQLLGEIL